MTNVNGRGKEKERERERKRERERERVRESEIVDYDIIYNLRISVLKTDKLINTILIIRISSFDRW